MLTGPPPKFHGTWDILTELPAPTKPTWRTSRSGVF